MNRSLSKFYFEKLIPMSHIKQLLNLLRLNLGGLFSKPSLEVVLVMQMEWSLRWGVNFTNLLAQSTNVLQSCFCAIQFHQHNCVQLYLYIQLKNTLNFYTVCPALYANMFSINLLAAFGPLECWCNCWAKESVSPVFYGQVFRQFSYTKIV